MGRNKKGRKKMNHPLTGNLRDLKDTELDEKLKKLTTRLVQAYRSSPDVVPQMQMVLNDYTEERTRRDREALKKVTDKAKEKGNDWDDIIDIG
jgi:GH35 family endo-1,4-beta-xylanase|tara:strand:+ start:829 stop:1107 length:279 start_codon:yes stop_codon:yes gene_type:complete